MAPKTAIEATMKVVFIVNDFYDALSGGVSAKNDYGCLKV